MSALLVFSMWPTGATRALAEAITPQDTQEAVGEVYEPEAQEQQAAAGDQAVNEAQAADEVKAAAEAEAAAAAEAERAAAEQAAAGQAAADQAAAEQAAAEAETNRQVNVGIDVPNATLYYNGQAFTAPTESITVPVHAAFVFSVAPMAGYNLKAVKTLVNGQETELHADAQGLYTIDEATLDSNVTVKVEIAPPLQSKPTSAPEVVAPAGDASQGQDVAETPADEPKTDEGAADTVAPSEGSATTTEGNTPAGDTAADANGAASVAETGNGEADVNAAALVDSKTITVGQSIELTSRQSGTWCSHTWSTNNAGVATVSNSDSETVTVTGVAPGTAVIADEYSPFLGTAGTDTYNITVVLPNATSVEISGKDTVGESGSIQLTAVTDPANAGGTTSWTSSNDEVLTVDQNGKVTGHRRGTATVEVTFTNADGTSVTARKDITVVASTPVTSVSILGESSVTQFSTLQLTAETEPADADGTASWASSNEAILTVDENGLVTGLRQGTATVTLTFTNTDGSSVIATKDITVEADTNSTDEAIVYYLLDPSKDANSNDTVNWGPEYGTATVNVTGATWKNDKNCFDNVDQRVVYWPNGTNVVPKSDEAWKTIFNNYKASVEEQLGVEITEDDVEEIVLVPAKISKNNGTDPDMHLDCNVSIRCKNVALVKYYLRDAGSTQFAQLGSKNYKKGDKTQPADVNADGLPETKVVDGVTYTFSNWYLDQSFTQPVTFPYTVNDTTNFYAKYVGGYQVIYDLNGGTWGSSDATMYTAPEGSTQTVRHEPTLEGFKFTGWTVEGLDNVTTLASGDPFTMPSHNVTLKATWAPLVSYQVKYLEKGTNKELATADTGYGELGEDCIVTAKTIDGYHLIDGCPAEQTHTIVEGDNTVVFLYEKDPVAYTVNYYLNGTEIKVADSDTKYAPWGSVVSVTDCAKTIAGYTVVPGQNATITVERSGSNVINVYYYQNVTLTAISASKVYNGSEQTVSGFTGAPKGADFSAITVGAAGTNVGTYDAIFAKDTVGTHDATGKYIVTKAEDGRLTITPYAAEIVIKIKGATGTKTYNGTEQSVKDFTVESISSNLITSDQVVLRDDVVAKATGKDARTTPYYMGLAGTSFTLKNGVSDNFTNIRFDVTDGFVKIDKAPVTLKSADLSKEYDGTALVNGGTALETESGWAPGEGATYAFTGTQTAVGSSANAFSYTLSSNTKAENYTITKTDGTLTVTDRAEKYQVTVVANSATATYDGMVHEARGLESTTVIANGHTFTVEGLTTSNPEGIDAGEYTNHITGTPVIKDEAGNDVTSQFEVTRVDGTLTIAKRAVTIKPVEDTKQYDGTPLVATAFEVVSGSFAAGEGIESCTYAGQQIQVGSSKSTIETVTPMAGTDLEKNYNLTKDPGTLTVTNRGAKYEVTVKANSVTATYDGTEHTASGLVTDKFKIDGVEYTVSGLTAEAKGTDVGTYVNTVTGTAKVTDPAGNDVTAQFAVSTKDGKLEIAKRPVTLTSADASKPYDGTALTNDKVTVSGDGFVEGQGATYSVTGSQTNAGTSANTFTYALNEGTNPDNYAITKSEGTLKVTANEQAVVVKVKGNTNTQLYDGAEHVATGYSVEGVTVDGVASDLYGAKADVDFTFKDTASAKRTDAGTTVMGLKAEQFENINNNFSNVTFEIVEDGSVTVEKREVTLTSASATKTYDGTALVKGEVTVSGDGFVMGQGATYSVTGSQLNRGESDNTFTYALTEGTNADNYTITTHEGTLTVNPVKATVVVTIVGNHEKRIYNGEELSTSGYTFSSNNELYTQDKVVFSGTAEAKRTDAGLTIMGLKADQFSNGDAANFTNVVFEVTDGYVGIARAQVTLKSADLSKEYDGTALVNGGTALKTESGWAPGEGATHTFTGSQTVVGSSPNAFTYALNEGTNPDNYIINKTEGTLTVTSRDAKYEVTVKANSATATYDGKAHEAAGVETDTFVIDGITYTVSGLTTENPSKIDAGKYTNNITGTPVVTDGNGNVVTDQFTVNTENGTLVINKAEVTMTSASGEWTYDGTTHSKHEMETVSGFAEGEGATFTYSASITNVGKVENAFAYKLNANTKASNYRFTTNNGTLKVTPVTDKVTVAITGNSKTEAYDGTEKMVTGYTVISNNAAYTEANIKFTGTAVAKGTVVGTYDMGLNADQFSNTSDNFTNVEFIVNDGRLTITGGEIDVDGVDWRTQDEQKVYDGDPLSAHEASATDKNGNALKVEYSVDDGKTWVSDPDQVNLTHFGHQTVMLRATGPNYAEGQYATSSESIAITKRLVTLTSEDANKTYDGTALTNGTVTATPKGEGVGFVDGEGATITVTGSQTAVGESDNTFTYEFNEGTNAADYLVTSKYGKLIVTADDSEVVVTITEHSGSFDYDGTEKTVEGYDFAASNPLYTQADFEFSGDATVSGTDAGTYDMELKADDFKNTSASFSKVTFVVVDGALTITPKGIEPTEDNGMTVDTLPDVVYNGTEQAQKPVVKDGDKSLVEGEDYELSYSADVTNAGTVTVTVTGKGNYAGTAQVTYQILKRQVELSSGSKTWPYDGQAHSLTEVSGWEQSGDKGFVTGEVADVRATGTVTKVEEGPVTNTIAYTELAGFRADNYTITKDEGTLEVTPATGKVVVTVTERGGSYTYDGTEKSAEGYDFVASDPLYTQADFAFTGDATVRGTDAGTYEMQLKSSDFANTNANFAEVEFVVVDNELTIARRTVTLTSADGSKVYDGIALTKNEQSDVTVAGGEGFVAGETLAYEISGTQTVVGSSENTFVAVSSETAKVDNYDVTYVYGNLTVTAQSIVPDPESPDTFKGVTVDDPADSVYDGRQHKWYPAVTGTMGNALVEGEDYTVSYDKDDFTNVTGDITVTITGMGNYTGTVTKTYKITKAPLTVAALSASKVYDGSALTAGGTIDGLVADETAQAVTSGSQTEVGSSVNAVDSIAWGTALEGNYYIASQADGTLTVTPKGIAPEPGNGMTVGTLPDVVYNGSEQAQKPSVMDGETELVEGVDYDLTYSDDLTNAGTVTVTVTGKGNYAGGVDVTYQITPAALTVATPSASKVYDGEALAAEGSVSGFVAGESAPFATTGSQTLVGSSTNTYAIDWAAEGATAKQSNYVISEELGTLTVTETTDEIVATPASYTGVYDGTAHGVNVTVTGLPKGYSVKSAISYAQATDVTGDAPVVANVDELVIVNAQGEDVTANLNVQKGTGTITITPATLTVTTPSASKAYDGEALTAEGKVSGFVAGESATLITTGSQTLVGMSDNTYELNWDDNVKAANYEIVENIGTLEVTQSQAAIVIVPQGASKTYDGTPLEAAGYDVYGLPAGFTLTAVVKGSQTNVGGSYAEVDSYVIENAAGEDVTDQFANVSCGKATLSVAKRPVTITSADATQVYNGAELTAHEATVTAGEGIVEGETLEYEFFGSQIPVGTSQNTFVARSGEGTDVDNYDITYVYGTLTVTPKGIAPEPGNGMTVGTLPDVVYNGSEQAQKPSVMDGETELVEGVDYDLTYSDDLTNAGTVTVTVTGKGNYAGGVDVTYQITPAALTVATPSASKVYDGEALAAEGSVSGFVAGESAPFATTGSQTLVGSSTNTYAIDWAAEGATAKQSNYVVSEELGTLTVTDGTDDDPVDPSLVINKTHENGTYALGDTVDFTLTATNVYGEARTMTFVEQEGVEIIGQTVFENVEPGVTVSTTARYTVTEADILAGGFTNTATVSFEGGKVFDGKDDVVVEKVVNALEVTKTIASAPADGVSFNEGETVIFVVTVTNKGNQTLKDVQVMDKLAGTFLVQGESELIESLAPGETVTLYYGYTITANDLGKEFRNVAVATAGNGTTGEGESPVIPVAPMSPEPNPDQKPDSKPGAGKPAIPKTADETPDGLMAALANLGLASLAAGLACLFVIPRRREN